MEGRVTASSEKKVTPLEYAALFREKRGLPEKITGVCGRIVRGKNEADFEGLGNKRLVWVFGPTTLLRFLDKTGLQILLDMGKHRAWVADKLREGMKWKLIVLPEAACERADWDGVFKLIKKHYPEVVSTKLLRWAEGLRAQSLKAMLQEGLIDAEDAKQEVKDNPKHPRHMNEKKYERCSDNLENARLFLWHSLGLNELYAGDGYTYNEEGQRCEEEYLMPVRPLSSFDSYALVDLGVSLFSV